MPDTRLQTSIVLSQRTWPGVGDLDDCWVLSILQCVLACLSWAHLPGTTAVRKAAGDPDDGKADGGNIAEIIRAAAALWPVLEGKLTPIRGGTPAALRAAVRAGRPASVALMLDKLPPALRYNGGSATPVAHQVTLAQAGDQLLLANPLKAMGQPWDVVTWAQVVPAIRAYGNGAVFAVLFPTSAAMAPYAPGVAELVAAAHGDPDPAALEAARQAGYAAGFGDAKAAATSAVAAIAPAA